MFSVEAASGQYWRISGLSQFDGTIWGLPDLDLQSADGVLNVATPGAPLLQQLFHIERLGGHFVPAAFTPLTVAQKAASNLGLPASASAPRTAATPMSVTVTPSKRPNGWIPMPVISTPAITRHPRRGRRPARTRT